MNPSDIAHLNVPSDPRVSPDGAAVAFVVSTPNLEDDRYDTVIWVGDREFTTGPGDSMPRWSPDGSLLARIRKIDDSTEILVLPTTGGEAREVASFQLGVEALEWSPDGRQLLVVAITFDDEWAELDDAERRRRPRRIGHVPYKYDNKGWLHDRRRHIWLIDVDDGTRRCLTPGEFDEEMPAWSPDGNSVAFVSDRDPNRGLVSGNDVWEVNVESGDLTRVTERGFWATVSYSPSGSLHMLGNKRSNYPVDFHLHRRDEGDLVDLTGHLDRGSVSLAAGPPAIRWSGPDALVGFEDSGRFGLLRVSPDGDHETLVASEVVVTGFDARAGHVAYTASTWDSPGELFVDGEVITELNTAEIGLVEPQHLRVDSGGHEIDVWVYLPEGDEPVPLLLNIHGGPASQWGYGFFDEFQVYAGAGYGVVACNPRGSSGRGEEFLRAVVGEGWGNVDHADINAAVDAAATRFDRLDLQRMGIMGGSYGGFMTAWMIGKEGRWRSAVVERALTSWTSFAGTSDIGGVFPENYTGASYPDSWEQWWRLSPLSLAHEVQTPTLILHAEDDHRCPIEQAEQYFMALLRNGTPTELMRFPGEGHEMSRSGKPRHRVERFEAILDWHARYLNGEG